ncbi:hypothetical protein BJ878DRAFT_503078 [Calycina marina]|uniref:Uncharacterized protein n=1 Tax=Calycina marina TaxID=1763456 RepID=A0A9P7Z4A5_9HELO|nr:hypothetical protein BJ878DRAFT_503078 [Calycina marina]
MPGPMEALTEHHLTSGAILHNSTTTSESLTNRSTESMENDSPRALTPDEKSSGNTPLQSLDSASNGINNAPHGYPYASLNSPDKGGIEVDEQDMDSSAIVVENDRDDSYMDDYDDIVPAVAAKRKRTSTNYSFEDGYAQPAAEHMSKKSKPQKIRGVQLGVWSNSSESSDADKHVIYGFIDIHDRLRTRIYGMNRRGETLVGNMPQGAGGCWVTFERVIFDPHLKGLGSAEVKEYVKLRSDNTPIADLEERAKADIKAVEKAKVIAATYAPETPKFVPHRPIKHPSSTSHRTSLPNQSAGGSPRSSRMQAPKAPNHTQGFRAINSLSSHPPSKHSPLNDKDKPSGVILGYWADSSEHRLEDKHAVYGLISGTNTFRVQIQKCTRDGRFLEGNYPAGPGRNWIHYDKLVVDPQFADMTRPEIKEYVRIRQAEGESRDSRESEKERRLNEAQAIRQARENIAHSLLQVEAAVAKERAQSDEILMETRLGSRSEAPRTITRQTETAAALTRQEKAEARERQLAKTRKESAAAAEESAQAELKNNLKKLNKVWIAQRQQHQQQQQVASPSPVAGTSPPVVVTEEVRYHNGVKYERKQAGPFMGKLVSVPQILSIDGEDYVEYRVLTKPTF